MTTPAIFFLPPPVMVVSPCASKTWPAPRLTDQSLATCMPRAAGEAGAGTGWNVEIYPVSCAADDVEGARQIIDCLLFKKWKFEQEKNNLRGVLANRPPVVTSEERRSLVNLLGDAKMTDDGRWTTPISAVASETFTRLNGKGLACLNWLAAMGEVTSRMLDATNIQEPWVQGGLVPTGLQTDVWLTTADDQVWPALNRAVLTATSAPNLMGSKLAIPYLTTPAYVTAPYIERRGFTSRGLLPRVDARDFGNLAQYVPETDSNRGAAWAYQMALPNTGWPTNVLRWFSSPMPSRSTGGMGAGRNPAWINRQKKSTELFALFCGDGTWHGGALERGGRQESAKFMSLTAIMDWWAALAQDLLTVPYERYVAFGVEQWTTVMASWASAGLLNKNAQQLSDLARQSAAVGQRVAIGTGAAVVGGIATAVNPIAGIVVGVMGAVTDLLFALGLGAVGGWNCPPPLLYRQAGGACDFTRILGAAENVASQATFVLTQTERTAREAADAQLEQQGQQRSAATSAPVFPAIAAGAAGVGLGLGLVYLFLKRR